VLGDPVLKRIGSAHSASENQVSLAWLMQQGVIVIPASGSRAHLQSNFGASDIHLSDADMAAIAKLDRGERIIDPSDAPEWD
jgi:2,5-diketo-D-gluconate reductase B